ncbi:transcriptional regulator [Bacilli bacterium]|nr:transcriptional regulator [Bacilli bacterium]GHU45087.1 transcriptional regulator [Bacilli bacterium]
MISKNIRSIRQTHDLTLLEFANIIGVSRNNIIRYENGSSEIPLKVVDMISKKFNEPYSKIIGEENHELALKIEVVKEVGVSVLADFLHYLKEHHIDFEDRTNPLANMAFDLSIKLNSEIYQASTISEIERVQGFVEGIQRMLKVTSGTGGLIIKNFIQEKSR